MLSRAVGIAHRAPRSVRMVCGDAFTTDRRWVVDASRIHRAANVPILRGGYLVHAWGDNGVYEGIDNDTLRRERGDKRGWVPVRWSIKGG